MQNLAIAVEEWSRASVRASEARAHVDVAVRALAQREEELARSEEVMAQTEAKVRSLIAKMSDGSPSVKR